MKAINPPRKDKPQRQGCGEAPAGGARGALPPGGCRAECWAAPGVGVGAPACQPHAEGRCPPAVGHPNPPPAAPQARVPLTALPHRPAGGAHGAVPLTAEGQGRLTPPPGPGPHLCPPPAGISPPRPHHAACVPALVSPEPGSGQRCLAHSQPTWGLTAHRDSEDGHSGQQGAPPRGCSPQAWAAWGGGARANGERVG